MNYTKEKVKWFGVPLFTIGILFGVCFWIMCKCIYLIVDGERYFMDYAYNKMRK